MVLYVQYGSGFSCPEEWLNFDASPTLRIERLPVLGRFITKNSARFPASTRFGDIVRGLPVREGSADGVYASHVLEHLSRTEFDIALRNTYRILRPGGVFRLIVPDLETRAHRYIARLNSGDASANDWFMRATHLGLEQRPATFLGKISRLVGGSAHLWMWDFLSIETALRRVGFTSIRRCELGDSGDPMFALVEDQSRFHDKEQDIVELAVHCSKPQ